MFKLLPAPGVPGGAEGMAPSGEFRDTSGGTPPPLDPKSAVTGGDEVGGGDGEDDDDGDDGDGTVAGGGGDGGCCVTEGGGGGGEGDGDTKGGGDGEGDGEGGGDGDGEGDGGGGGGGEGGACAPARQDTHGLLRVELVHIVDRCTTNQFVGSVHAVPHEMLRSQAQAAPPREPPCAPNWLASITRLCHVPVEGTETSATSTIVGSMIVMACCGLLTARLLTMALVTETMQAFGLPLCNAWPQPLTASKCTRNVEGPSGIPPPRFGSSSRGQQPQPRSMELPKHSLPRRDDLQSVGAAVKTHNAATTRPSGSRGIRSLTDETSEMARLSLVRSKSDVAPPFIP